MTAIENTCSVKYFKMVTPTVFTLGFQTALPLQFSAGQFVSVIIPGAGPRGRDLRRAYSIASPPEAPCIELCVKLVEGGPGTQYLSQLREGDPFRIVAPYGDFIFHPQPERHVCFVSTGTGIAPFHSMILSTHFQSNLPKSTTCATGVRHETELLYEAVLSKIPHLHWLPAVSQPSSSWTGYHGRVTQYFKDLTTPFPWKETDYYLCGHGGMISEMKAFLTEKGVQKESLHQEIYYK